MRNSEKESVTKPVFSEKTDIELVRQVKKDGDSESFLEICRRYENVFYKICQRYTNALIASGLDPKDIFDERYNIIFNCVSSFKTSKKTKLSTWIGNHARYLCLNSINQRRFILPQHNDIHNPEKDVQKYIEDTQNIQSYFDTAQTADNYQYVMNILSQFKDKRIAQVFELRYELRNLANKKLIWGKIAKKMDVSTQTAINLHNQGLKLIKRKIKSANISDVV